ncbi:MAG: response regulator [Gemmataceae bacterium]|nr:response regulator [Gemmata sp.]MDW8198169.1 response regulator [Gemmataceae bacterium]
MSVEHGLSSTSRTHSSSLTNRPPVILVAEDDDAVRTFVVAALQQAGYVVVAAVNGHSAQELFVANPAQFDLVLTDVIMPQVLGTELAACVRQLRPEVPVLFMSAFPGGVNTAPEPLPVDEPLLEKPFSITTLLEAVRHALRR